MDTAVLVVSILNSIAALTLQKNMLGYQSRALDLLIVSLSQRQQRRNPLHRTRNEGKLAFRLLMISIHSCVYYAINKKSLTFFLFLYQFLYYTMFILVVEYDNLMKLMKYSCFV